MLTVQDFKEYNMSSVESNKLCVFDNVINVNSNVKLIIIYSVNLMFFIY